MERRGNGSSHAQSSHAEFPHPGSPHLEARDVRVVHGHPRSKDAGLLAVDGLDLTTHRGELVCIVGPSGCGKTTFRATRPDA